MAGLFDNLKSAKVSSRNDDGIGRYWQRLDKISVEGDGARLQILKTNVNVVEGNKPVGEQTSHAIFPDKNSNYNYFEQDVKKFLQASFGLSTEQINDMRKAESVKAFLTFAKATTAQVGLDGADRPLNETEIRMLDDIQTLKGVLKNLPKLNEVLRGTVLETRVTTKPNPKDANKPYLVVRYLRSVPVDEIKAKVPENRIAEFFPAGL